MTIEALLEQASYSGGRFLFWVMTPLFAPNEWQAIATLSLMNLLTMAVYSAVIGGPSFYRLVRGAPGDALAGFFHCHALILMLSLAGPAVYAALYGAEAADNLLLLILVPWISTAADWSRRTMILLGRQRAQVARNLSFVAIWLGYAGLFALQDLPTSLNYIALAFCLINAVIYLPVRGVLRGASTAGRAALMPFSVWRHYLFAGLVAYAVGNLLFWNAADQPALVQFVVLRNYLTPVLLLSLYIESYGAVKLEASDQKWRVIRRYTLGVVLVSALLSLAILSVLSLTRDAAVAIDPVIFALVALTTLLIALIKIPTVYLRLCEHDHLVSWAYVVLLPIWPVAFASGLVAALPYAGLEIMFAQYLVLLALLSALAVTGTKRRANHV